MPTATDRYTSYGARLHHHPNNPETWIWPECDGQRVARVICPDGKLRIMRCAGTADTFFSISADDRRGGHGFIDSRDDGFHYQPYTRA
jgi:hypothetical protein